jgi:hypothetical protein
MQTLGVEPDCWVEEAMLFIYEYQPCTVHHVRVNPFLGWIIGGVDIIDIAPIRLPAFESGTC